MKQKSIQQQLQSRISLRRNYITELEARRYRYRADGSREHVAGLREALQVLVSDQKLDRKLYEMVLVRERVQRVIDRMYSEY